MRLYTVVQDNEEDQYLTYTFAQTLLCDLHAASVCRTQRQEIFIHFYFHTERSVTH
jgi:heat shock protein HspQ